MARSIYRGCTCYLLEIYNQHLNPSFIDTTSCLEISGGDDDDSDGVVFPSSMLSFDTQFILGIFGTW